MFITFNQLYNWDPEIKFVIQIYFGPNLLAKILSFLKMVHCKSNQYVKQPLQVISPPHAWPGEKQSHSVHTKINDPNIEDSAHTH
jgi:hypothetical protein